MSNRKRNTTKASTPGRRRMPMTYKMKTKIKRTFSLIFSTVYYTVCRIVIAAGMAVITQCTLGILGIL